MALMQAVKDTVKKLNNNANSQLSDQEKQEAANSIVKEFRDNNKAPNKDQTQNPTRTPRTSSTAAQNMPGARSKPSVEPAVEQPYEYVAPYEPEQPKGLSAVASDLLATREAVGQLPPEAENWSDEDRQRIVRQNIAKDRREKENERELLSRYYENNPEYMNRYAEYANSVGEAGGVPEDYRTKGMEWDQEIEREEQPYDQEAYIEYVMNETPEGEAWRKEHLNGEAFNYYEDFPTLATDGSQSSEDVWTLLYTDPNAYNDYYDMIGTEIDVDDNGEISEQEARDFYKRMQEYNPEYLDPYGTDDPEMGWIYGRYGDNMAVSNHTFDAYSNWQTNQVRNALIDGTYADMIANGELNELIDKDGNSLVRTLGMDTKAQRVANLIEQGYSADDPEMVEAMDDLDAACATYNNIAKETAMGDYLSENPDYNGYLLDFNNVDYTSANNRADQMMYGSAGEGEDPTWFNMALTNLSPEAKQAIYDQSVRRAEDAAYAEGLNSLYNNTQGGRADFGIVGPDGLEHGSYDERINEAPEGDILDYTGSNAISDQQNLQYLMMQRAGLNDRGYNQYSGWNPPSEEEILEAQEAAAREARWDEQGEYGDYLRAQYEQGQDSMEQMYGEYADNTFKWPVGSTTYTNRARNAGEARSIGYNTQPEPYLQRDRYADQYLGR